MTWLHLLFNRGQVLVDEYLGPVSRQNVKTEPAPMEVSKAFNTYLARAPTLASERVTKLLQDADGHFELGTALGLQASWTATVEGRVMGAFGAARRAYNEHERVLALAPSRKDAGLIVGTYRYLVGSMAMPVRWMAYVAGFGGDKERGLRMIEDAATYGDANRFPVRTRITVQPRAAVGPRDEALARAAGLASAQSSRVARSGFDPPSRRRASPKPTPCDGGINKLVGFAPPHVRRAGPDDKRGVARRALEEGARGAGRSPPRDCRSRPASG